MTEPLVCFFCVDQNSLGHLLRIKAPPLHESESVQMGGPRNLQFHIFPQGSSLAPCRRNCPCPLLTLVASEMEVCGWWLWGLEVPGQREGGRQV